MISPRLSKVFGGTRLTTDLINSMIKRTEYAADLLQQYKLIAGNQMYIEPHYDGTRVSYLQPVGGGATPRQDLNTYYIGDNEGTDENPFTSDDVLRIFSDSTKFIDLDVTRYYAVSGTSVDLYFYPQCVFSPGAFAGMAAYGDPPRNTIAIGLCPTQTGIPGVLSARNTKFYIRPEYHSPSPTQVRQKIPGGYLRSS